MNKSGTGNDGLNWPETADAAVWTNEFKNKNSASDWGTMVGWFANAIEAGMRYEASKFKPCCDEPQHCKQPCVHRAKYWENYATLESARADHLQKKLDSFSKMKVSNHKPVLATMSDCCGIIRKGYCGPSVMHTALCMEEHGNVQPKTIYLVEEDK